MGFFVGGGAVPSGFFLFLLISQIYSNCFSTENALNFFRHLSSRSAERPSLSHLQTILGDQVDEHLSSLQKTTSVVCIWPLTMPTFILLQIPVICKLCFYCSFLVYLYHISIINFMFVLNPQKLVKFVEMHLVFGWITDDS